MGISASVIVKNEEEVLPRMLECVSKWADEIVIVDTGSTDRTVEIAQAHPKVRFFYSNFFNKDTDISDFQFNVAKNEAIDRCREDWICWWDADDFIDDENAFKIKSLAQGAPIAPSLYTFEMRFEGMIFEHCRLFMNGYNIRFDEHHSCHEYLNTLGHPHHHRRDIVIQHRPGKNHSNSATRNLSILEKDYYKRGYDDQRTLFYLANSYRESGKPENAIGFYDKYLKISQWPEERFFARLYKGGCFRALNKQVDARREYLLCLIEDFRFAEPYAMLGDISLTEGDLNRAEHWYKMALATPFPTDSRLFAVGQMYDSYPKGQLELVYKKRGDKPSEPNVPNPYGVSPKDNSVSDSRPVVKYDLPEDRREMFLALSAFEILSACNGVLVEVVCPDEFSKEIAERASCVKVSQGEGMKVGLPTDLKDKHGVEWMCRSAGMVPKGIGSFSLNGKCAPTKNKVVIQRGPQWGEENWNQLRNELQDVNIVDVTGRDGSSVVHEMEDAHLFVCEGDWGQHLSKAMGVDTVVLWGDSMPEQNGWFDQENMVHPRNGKLNLISPSSIKDCIERRLDYA